MNLYDMHGCTVDRQANISYSCTCAALQKQPSIIKILGKSAYHYAPCTMGLGAHPSASRANRRSPPLMPLTTKLRCRNDAPPKWSAQPRASRSHARKSAPGELVRLTGTTVSASARPRAAMRASICSRRWRNTATSETFGDVSASLSSTERSWPLSAGEHRHCGGPTRRGGRRVARAKGRLASTFGHVVVHAVVVHAVIVRPWSCRPSWWYRPWSWTSERRAAQRWRDRLSCAACAKNHRSVRLRAPRIAVEGAPRRRRRHRRHRVRETPPLAGRRGPARGLCPSRAPPPPAAAQRATRA